MKETEAINWLTDLLLAASLIDNTTPEGTDKIIISPKGNKYGVGEKIGTTDFFSLYRCRLSGNRIGILKISTNKTGNSLLDKEALILKMLREKSLTLDINNSEKDKFNYHYFFPELVETFICEEQDDRRIAILCFPGPIDSLEQLKPLSYLKEKENVYVDPRTGAWIIGKLLKTIAFAHEQGVSNDFIATDNILIERDLHGLMIFDWSQAKISSEEMPSENICKKEIMQAACLGIEILGGDQETGRLPKNEQLANNIFEKYLFRLATGSTNNAAQAKQDFYNLIWGIWPRKFHKFTTYQF